MAEGTGASELEGSCILTTCHAHTMYTGIRRVPCEVAMSRLWVFFYVLWVSMFSSH